MTLEVEEEDVSNSPLQPTAEEVARERAVGSCCSCFLLSCLPWTKGVLLVWEQLIHLLFKVFSSPLHKQIMEYEMAVSDDASTLFMDCIYTVYRMAVHAPHEIQF